MADKQKILLATIMKFAKKNNYDTDAVLDLWNQNPDELRTAYLEALTRPTPATLTEEDADIDSMMRDMAKDMKSNKLSRHRPDLGGLRNILKKIRQEFSHKNTPKGLEMHFRVSSELSGDYIEETLTFPPGTDIDSEPIEMIIDQTLSSLSYEYLLGL